ncbi:methyltransferase domain-containing protein [Komagataeibacter swingsii]|uniref:SAM-dependent methyltransferase n=1 Tax=Komagataeibacter swingsii TaxID=215220 RepID=A0A2V4RPG3_9PROT|nr:methyltransferase domain-containing protein [Komagataeibacter swingsii]PYD70515.1 SAM-dependent methyltransferase [Komagataeibacter swingsii]GBQ59215.1 methyltransferase [Komagataeibacter swingsii DSM 16373]
MSMDVPQIFDRHAVRLHRDRAAATLGQVRPVLAEAADRLLDRLDDVTRPFHAGLDIGGRGVVAQALRARGVATVTTDLSRRMCAADAGPAVCMDAEWLPFAPHSFDLVVACLSLHWVNDLPGVLAQVRSILAPDGLFLACMPVLPTLGGLRHALMEAEMAQRGGVSPRISPFPGVRDCAYLLQRAGFALPVVDADVIHLSYRTPMGLLADLRNAGETNALRTRARGLTHPALLADALGRLPVGEDGSLDQDLHVAMMTGWSPAPSQPQPLRPGQFGMSLEDALRGTP